MHTVLEKSALLPYLFKHFTRYKKTKVRQFLKFGSVEVNGKVTTRHDHALSPGDRIEFLGKKEAAGERAKTGLGFPIVFEDEAVLIVEKPPGLLSIGTEKEKEDTLYWKLTDYTRRKAGPSARVWVVHRLDREASGLMVFAKNPRMKAILQKNWQGVEKKYFAVVEGVPSKSEDTIESWLTEDKFRRVYGAGRAGPRAKRSVTHYRLIKENGRYALLDVTLTTGRKNQVRVHLAGIGHPIVGDAKYGARTDPAGRLGLHAHALSLTHPLTGKRLNFESPLPKNLFPEGSRSGAPRTSAPPRPRTPPTAG